MSARKRVIKNAMKLNEALVVENDIFSTAFTHFA